MAISPNIKYDFSQITTGLIAFVADLEKKLQHIIPNIPVFVMQTGDTSYYMDKKFNQTQNEEIYQKIPRFVINFEDIQYQTDQDTNKYNKFTYKFEDEIYLASGRRIAIMVPINTDFISSNFIKALENFEILNAIFISPNIFTYEFLGNTFESAYTLATPSMEKPQLDAASGTRNISVKSQLELQIHLLTPRIASIKRLSDSGFEAIQYNIDINNTESIDTVFNNLKTE